MGKIVSVASQYTIYEVPDDAFELLSNGITALPPAIVLETLVLNGKAVRVGTVGTLTMGLDEMPEEFDTEDMEDPPEGEGPWLEEDED